ncbi:MAG: methylated-DNA--[protein]-cysteine S-methyltransferase [Anaerolineaceae bacterium]|nr:methylated-DNA--[protein]-cysteine S-methyltransferase [Anaerolineaceae bacterium]
MNHITQFQCPLGTLFAIAEQEGIVRLDFLDNPLDEDEQRALATKQGITDNISFERNALLDELVKQIARYFQGKRRHFDLPLLLRGTTFQRQVWDALLTIPYGTTISYGQLAVKVGRSSAESSRAVANANARNPIAILVPCHRVIGADGSLTGYAGGLWRKQALLTLEGVGLPFPF